jgi:hypothetical protein
VPKAEAVKKRWEDNGTLNVAPLMPDPDRQASPIVAHVIEQFTKDREARTPSPATLKKYRQSTELLAAFCTDQGIDYITKFGIDHARAFRESWAGAAITNLKRNGFSRGDHLASSRSLCWTICTGGVRYTSFVPSFPPCAKARRTPSSLVGFLGFIKFRRWHFVISKLPTSQKGRNASPLSPLCLDAVNAR